MHNDESRKVGEQRDRRSQSIDPIAADRGASTEPTDASAERAFPGWANDRTPRHGPGTAEPLEAGNKMILVGIAALAGGVLFALSMMLGDNGTHNDANNRGPSGQAHNPSEAVNAHNPKLQ